MNIRIGNDIKVKMPISDIGNIVVDDISSATCVFKLSKQQASNPLFHQPTSYTIHGYGNLSYNVNPCKRITDYTDLHNRGFVGSKPGEYVSSCTINDEYIYASFPSEYLNIIGSYDCVFNIKVKETGWDNDNIHAYRSAYYELFTLVDDVSGNIGSITINAINKDTNEIYVFALTDSQLTDLNGNYSQVLPTADKFSLSQLGVSGKTVVVVGTNKRICFISNKGDLKMSYNSFIIPMSMYKLDNGSYLYLSDYTYSDITIDICVINTGVINTISTKENTDTDTKKDTDTDTKEDDPTDPVVVYNNSIVGNNIKLYGTISSAYVLNTNGSYISSTYTIKL